MLVRYHPLFSFSASHFCCFFFCLSFIGTLILFCYSLTLFTILIITFFPSFVRLRSSTAFICSFICSSLFCHTSFCFRLYSTFVIFFMKWQPNHLHLLLVSSNWRNSSPVLCVLTSIPTLRPYLVYTLSVRPVLRGFLKIRRVRPITSLVPLVVIVQSYQEEEQEPFL